jgi:hypothetical protein
MYSDPRVTQQTIENSRKDSSLKVPSTLKSAGMSLAETATAPIRFGIDVINHINGLPAVNPLDKSFEVFNKSLETPNTQWPQKTVDFFASGIGYLNPVSDIALAKPAIGAVEAVSGALSRNLPSAITTLSRTPMRKFGGRVGEMLPETIGGAAEHVAKAMTLGAAITTPEAFLDNYDEATGKFNIHGAANQAFSNGLLTVGIDLLPVTAGVIFGKHRRSFAKEYENPLPGDAHSMSDFDKALDNGEISPEEHDWIKTYLENPNDITKLKDKGVEVLLKEGYHVDTAKQEMLMNLMKKSHYDDFHTGMLDQISSGASGQFSSSLSDYIAATGLDFMTAENSKFLDGLNGYVHFMENRLEHEPKNMKRMSEARNKADLSHIEDDHPMSQRSLLKDLKSVNHDLQKLPNGVPKNLRFRASQERKLLRLKQEIGRFKKLAKRDKSYESRIDQASAEFRDIKSNIQKPLTTRQELKTLESHFLDRKALPDNYKQSHDYHRLVDLSHFSTKADALLHHIDLKHQYEVQTSYKDMIKFLNSVIESNVSKFADPNKVVDYFKARYDQVGTHAEHSSGAKSIKNTRDVPVESAKGSFSDVKNKDELRDMQQDIESDVRNDGEILQANQTDVDSVNSPEFESEYKAAKERYQQFKDNELSLSQLVSCELGIKEGSE